MATEGRKKPSYLNDQTPIRYIEGTSSTVLSELTLTSPSPHSEYTWKKGLVGTQREREAHQNPPAFHKEESGGPGVAEEGGEGGGRQQNLEKKYDS